MYSPQLMDTAPAMAPAIAVSKMSVASRLAPATPATSKNVDTKPSLTPLQFHVSSSKQDGREQKNVNGCARAANE